MSLLVAAIALAMSIWGLILPYTVTIEPTSWNVAWFSPNPDGSCGFHFDQSRLPSYTPAEIQSLALHEVGHCYGFDHYGDCNSVPSIMGCSLYGHLSDLDRARMDVRSGYRTTMPLLSHD